MGPQQDQCRPWSDVRRSKPLHFPLQRIRCINNSEEHHTHARAGPRACVCVCVCVRARGLPTWEVQFFQLFTLLLNLRKKKKITSYMRKKIGLSLYTCCSNFSSKSLLKSSNTPCIMSLFGTSIDSSSFHIYKSRFII